PSFPSPTTSFNDTATTDISTLSLHDALPISLPAEGNALAFASNGGTRLLVFRRGSAVWAARVDAAGTLLDPDGVQLSNGSTFPTDRKSTRLNSSHVEISYAVFCLKKKSTPSRATRALSCPSVNRPECCSPRPASSTVCRSLLSLPGTSRSQAAGALSGRSSLATTF